MEIEKKAVKLMGENSEVITAELIIKEDIPENVDMIILELLFNGESILGQSDNMFDSLKELRKQLEKKRIQILCNGAARNVYPSAMQFSMGNTRKAYKLYKGEQARMKDMVDIFELDDGLEFVDINEQLKFFEEWINR